jgi:hypothetical protein
MGQSEQVAGAEHRQRYTEPTIIAGMMFMYVVHSTQHADMTCDSTRSRLR